MALWPWHQVRCFQSPALLPLPIHPLKLTGWFKVWWSYRRFFFLPHLYLSLLKFPIYLNTPYITRDIIRLINLPCSDIWFVSLCNLLFEMAFENMTLIWPKVLVLWNSEMHLHQNPKGRVCSRWWFCNVTILWEMLLIDLNNSVLVTSAGVLYMMLLSRSYELIMYVFLIIRNLSQYNYFRK